MFLPTNFAATHGSTRQQVKSLGTKHHEYGALVIVPVLSKTMVEIFPAMGILPTKQQILLGFFIITIANTLDPNGQKLPVDSSKQWSWGSLLSNFFRLVNSKGSKNKNTPSTPLPWNCHHRWVVGPVLPGWRHLIWYSPFGSSRRPADTDWPITIDTGSMGFNAMATVHKTWDVSEGWKAIKGYPLLMIFDVGFGPLYDLWPLYKNGPDCVQKSQKNTLGQSLKPLQPLPSPASPASPARKSHEVRPADCEVCSHHGANVRPNQKNHHDNGDLGPKSWLTDG